MADKIAFVLVLLLITAIIALAAFIVGAIAGYYLVITIIVGKLRENDLTMVGGEMEWISHGVEVE